jgi:uncharacterized repeat protein (TIGR01451 family)
MEQEEQQHGGGLANAGNLAANKFLRQGMLNAGRALLGGLSSLFGGGLAAVGAAIGPFLIGCGVVLLVAGIFIFIVIIALSLIINPQSAGSEPMPSLLEVVKTPEPSRIEVGGNSVVKYTITVTNKSDIKIENIEVTDAKSEISYIITSLEKGANDPRSFDVNIGSTATDRVVLNTVTATANINGTTVSSSDVATVIIGNPPDQPPIGCPITGPITTPMGTNIPDYPSSGSRGSHNGVDISDGLNSEVKATLSGTAILEGGSDAAGGYQVRVCNSLYCARFVHLLDEGRVSGEVAVGDTIGYEDSTGTYTTGNHVHYEVYMGEVRLNPLEFMPVTLNYTPPPDLDFASFSSAPSSGWGSCNAGP